MNTEFKSLLKLMLPEFLIENYQITRVDDIATKIDIYLEENKDLPEELEEGNYISHGFHKQIKIKDFPLRGKQVNLFIKRRRWFHKETKEVLSKNWELIAKGTRMTDDFATFLKGIN